MLPNVFFFAMPRISSMKAKNTKITTIGNSVPTLFFSKILLISLLLFSQFIYSKSRDFYDDPTHNLEQNRDSISYHQADKDIAKIYISPGIEVVNKDSETNFEIAKIPVDQKHVVLKSKATKKSSQKILKVKLLKQTNAHQYLPEIQETITSSPFSGHAFSAHQVHKTVAAQTNIFTLKHLFKTGFCYSQVAFSKPGKIKIPVSFVYFYSKTLLSSYSVRPPPALS